MATMDLVGETTFCSALSQQGTLLGRHQDQISASNPALDMMASQLMELTTVVQQLRPPLDPMQETPPSPLVVSNTPWHSYVRDLLELFSHDARCSPRSLHNFPEVFDENCV